MPERPLLILPSPGEPVARQRRHGGGGSFHRPNPGHQAERMLPQFERLQQTSEERRARLRLEARALVLEEVLVPETVGTVDEFIRAVEAVPEMEWLAEVEAEEIPPDDDFFALTDDGEERPVKDAEASLTGLEEGSQSLLISRVANAYLCQADSDNANLFHGCPLSICAV